VGVKKGSNLNKEITLGVLATSAAAERGRFESAIAYLSSIGVKTKIGLQPWQAYGSTQFLFSSASAKDRANAFHVLMRDPQVDAVLSVRGAYGTMELLPLINFKALKKHPKPFIGFSDSTALLIALADRGLPAIHGPSLESAPSKAASDTAAKRSLDALLALLRGDARYLSSYALQPLIEGRGSEGKLSGGNLAMIASLMGTPFEPKLAGKLLFIEDINEKPYRIHRMLLQLKLAGKLKMLKGVVFGGLTNCVQPQGHGPTTLEVLKDIFSDARYPVMMGLPAGHEALNLALPLGRKARIFKEKLEVL
jgi:muramoyltetrapeptide carboxypeptidase